MHSKNRKIKIQEMAGFFYLREIPEMADYPPPWYANPWDGRNLPTQGNPWDGRTPPSCSPYGGSPIVFCDSTHDSRPFLNSTNTASKTLAILLLLAGRFPVWWLLYVTSGGIDPKYKTEVKTWNVKAEWNFGNFCLDYAGIRFTSFIIPFYLSR